MLERKPLYMGSIPKHSENAPIDGIDTLIMQSAEKMGAHVVDTQFTIFLGTNYRREYRAEPIEQSVSTNPADGQPELTSV